MQTPRPLSACAQHPARPTPDAGLRRAICLATALALTACSSVQLKHQVEKSVADNSQNTAQQRSVQADYAQKQAGPVRKVDGFWLGSRAIKLSPDQQLPPVFDQPHSLSLRYPTTLAGVADALTKVSGVMIRIQPDVYTAAPSAAPSAATVRPSSGGNISQTERDALYTGYLGADSLRGLLDKIAAQASISWEYRDGLVQFYRLQSRTFTLLLPPGEGDATVNVSKSATATSSGSGSGSNSGSASSSSDNKVSSTAKLQFWSNIERTLKAMLTAAGKAEISQTTGTVSVTDTRDAVERIAEYIERENAALTRQVQVDVKVLSVQTSDNGDLGLDWTAVYQKLTSNGLGNIGWSFGS
ncbi:secretin N-terminal domain-containing protein, partial [Parachitinimonas caeni]